MFVTCMFCVVYYMASDHLGRYVVVGDGYDLQGLCDLFRTRHQFLEQPDMYSSSYLFGIFESVIFSA
jgi:hypothetical protein